MHGDALSTKLEQWGDPWLQDDLRAVRSDLILDVAKANPIHFFEAVNKWHQCYDIFIDYLVEENIDGQLSVEARDDYLRNWSRVLEQTPLPPLDTCSVETHATSTEGPSDGDSLSST